MMMFQHTATVRRMVKSEDPVTGAARFTRESVHENVPCYLSQKQSGLNTKQDTGPNRIEYAMKVFFAPAADVLAGDLLDISVQGHTVTVVAGEPLRYRTHQEVPVDRSEVEA